MELNKILSTWDWGKASAALNSNFEKIKLELMKLRFASILTFYKGYFSTEVRFLAKFPTGKTGEYAFVGSPWPGTVYEWIDTKWVNTKVAPQLGEGIFMELLKHHIDNTTILWNDKEKYIYSLGGGDGSTFTIAVSIDASSVDKCTVEATGDVINVAPSSDGSVFTVVANAGGTVTVKVVSGSGYQVESLTVDGVSKGAVSEYTFENLDKNHTMSVALEDDWSKIVPPVYMRSDVSSAYFGIYNAIQSVVNDYPDGLTKDVRENAL